MGSNLPAIILFSLLGLTTVGGLIDAFFKGTEFLKKDIYFASFTQAILIVGSYRFLPDSIKENQIAPIFIELLALIILSILLLLLSSLLGDFRKRKTQEST